MTTKKNNNHTLAGIDYSISSPAIWIGDTGFAFGNKKRQGVYTVDEYTISIESYPSYSSDETRHRALCEWALGILTDHNVDRVMLEDYSYNSKGRSLFQIAECAGCLKQGLMNAGIPFSKVSPTAVKKRAVSGKADKHMMVDAFQRETGIDLFTVLDGNRESKTIVSPITDLCDAYWLYKLGL